MGKRLDFIDKVERLRFIRWMISDFFAIKNDFVEAFLYQISIKTFETWVVYDMKKWDSEKKLFMDEFQLIDERHCLNLSKKFAESEEKQIRDWLKTVIEEAYFEEYRMPNEIYKKCCVDLERHLKPRSLLKILQEETNLKDSPTIKRVEHKEGACYIKN